MIFYKHSEMHKKKGSRKKMYEELLADEVLTMMGDVEG